VRGLDSPSRTRARHRQASLFLRSARSQIRPIRILPGGSREPAATGKFHGRASSARAHANSRRRVAVQNPYRIHAETCRYLRNARSVTHRRSGIFPGKHRDVPVLNPFLPCREASWFDYLSILGLAGTDPQPTVLQRPPRLPSRHRVGVPTTGFAVSARPNERDAGLCRPVGESGAGTHERSPRMLLAGATGQHADGARDPSPPRRHR